ncbi:hypothetical protein GCM10009551_036650 [Nocardiopsis tropica]
MASHAVSARSVIAMPFTQWHSRAAHTASRTTWNAVYPCPTGSSARGWGNTAPNSLDPYLERILEPGPPTVPSCASSCSGDEPVRCRRVDPELPEDPVMGAEPGSSLLRVRRVSGNSRCVVEVMGPLSGETADIPMTVRAWW